LGNFLAAAKGDGFGKAVGVFDFIKGVKEFSEQKATLNA
jgi:ATP:corrinoid adenosyltransferase